MISCCASFFSANQRQFSDAVARRDLTRYRTRGPDRTTRLLRDAILGAGHGRTVLDVGAGIGALSFELLAAGAERVTAVEAATFLELFLAFFWCFLEAFVVVADFSAGFSAVLGAF